MFTHLHQRTYIDYIGFYTLCLHPCNFWPIIWNVLKLQCKLTCGLSFTQLWFMMFHTWIMLLWWCWVSSRFMKLVCWLETRHPDIMWISACVAVFLRRWFCRIFCLSDRFVCIKMRCYSRLWFEDETLTGLIDLLTYGKPFCF